MGTGLNGYGIVGNSAFTAKPLASGFVVGPTLAGAQWANPNQYLSAYSGDPPVTPGYGFFNFTDNAANYFRFRFKNGSDIFYGYAIVDYSTSPTATITDWYYNNTPNGSITVGQGADPVSSVPGPIGLAGLAAGAAWTRKLRRRIRESAEAA